MPDPKSFADLLSEILGEWQKFLRFILLVSFLCVLVFGLTYCVLHYGLSPETNEASLEIDKVAKVGVVLSQPVKGGREYLIVISPQGWQPTGIYVHKDETMNFTAGGKVYINLMDLNASLAARYKAEERVKKRPSWVTEKNEYGQEHYFTDRERKAIREPLMWSWTGPDGASVAEMRNATPARQKRSISPDAPYGALLAGLGDRDHDPDKIFLVGSTRNQTASRDGCLYFAVNDVLNDLTDPHNKDLPPNMFLVDNIGFFYAHVTVTSPGKPESKKKDEEGVSFCAPTRS